LGFVQLIAAGRRFASRIEHDFQGDCANLAHFANKNPVSDHLMPAVLGRYVLIEVGAKLGVELAVDDIMGQVARLANWTRCGAPV
jgi:hypothetical protein